MHEAERFAIKMLGGLTVAGNGVRVESFPTKRSALILCLVACGRQGMVARDELAERLWPEDYLDVTRLRLRQELKRLRLALGKASEILESDRNWVRLDLERVEVDSREFERYLQLAKTSETPARQLQVLERAAEVYAGPFLPEFNEDWVLSTRADLQTQYVDCLAQASLLSAETGARNRAIEFANAGFRAEPNRSAIVAQLMKLQIEAGQMESAAATLAAHTRALEKSAMGRPSAELAHLLRSAPQTAPTNPVPVPDAAPQAQLPKYHDLFCGRSQESQLIQQLLLAERGPRLITLVGTGGVGKTRLAVEVVADLKEELSGAAFFSLEVLDGAAVLERMSTMIRRHPIGIVILDNAETDLTGTSALVQKLRLDHPSLRILVTSRQALRVAGVQVVPIDPLPIPIYALSVEELVKNESARLFESRVQATNPSFRINQANASDVVRLLSQLDGLPLASEIAASGVATLGLRGVSERLDSRLTELVSNRTDIPDRHRSLRAAIVWSYQELSPEQRAVLRALAVLREGGSASLVEQMIGQDALAVVLPLCDRSLLSRVEGVAGPRFRLLESIRIFAERETNPSEAASLGATHARAIHDWLVATLPLQGSFAEHHWQQLEEEHENIRAAILWGQAHDSELALMIVDKVWRFWTMRGSARAGREILSALLGSAALKRSPLLARVKHAYSVVLYMSGRFQECSDVLDQLEALAAEVHEDFLLLTSRAMHGVVAMDLADYEQAYHLAKASWEGYGRLSGYEVDAMVSRATMARNAAFMGRAEEAIAEMEAVFAERIARAIPFETARGYRELAEVYRETGKDPFPIALQEKSLSLYRDLTARPWLIACLLDLHWSYAGVGRFADCIALEEELATLVEKTDKRLILGEISLGQAHRFRVMEDQRRARESLARALEIAVAESYVPLLLASSLVAGQILSDEGHGHKATGLVAQIRAIQRHRGGGLMASLLRELNALEAQLEVDVSEVAPLTPVALGAKALSLMVGW